MLLGVALLLIGVGLRVGATMAGHCASARPTLHRRLVRGSLLALIGGLLLLSPVFFGALTSALVSPV